MNGRTGFIAAVVGPIKRWSSAHAGSGEFANAGSAEHDHAELGTHVRPQARLRSNSGGSERRSAHHASTSPTSYGSTAYFDPADGTARLVTSSPERRRSRDSIALLNRVPEDYTMEFEPDQPPRYLDGAPLNGDDEEEEEWELDEELAAQGLYRGSYKRLMALYTLVPLTSIVSFIFMTLLPTFAYPLDRASPRSPYPYVSYLPFPLPELLASIAFWSLSHLLRDPLFVISSFMSRPFGAASVYVTTTLSTIFQTITSLFFSLIIIPILLIPHYNLAHHPSWEDMSFRRVWWVALGWAAAEAVVGIKQGYEGIGLYRDVLVTVRRSNGDLRKTSNATVKLDSAATARPRSGSGNGSPNMLAPGPSSISRQASREVEPQTVAEEERQPLLTRKPTNEQQDFLIQTALELEVERDLEQLIALKNREELEEVYGMPFIDIPVFLSCLHRVNSILSSLGLFLLLSAAYMRSRFADFPPPPTPGGMRTSSWIPGLHDALEGGKSNTYLIITLPVVLALQLLLAFLHTPLILPRIGVQSFVYVSLLVSLGMFFVGLGIWEALS